MTIENFVVHPDRGTEQRTDADLIAVRFGHRVENVERPMVDDPNVAACGTFVNVIIAEIKRGRCSLNGPWTAPGLENMQRVLRAVGCVPNASIQDAADALYARGHWSEGDVTIRLFAIGERRDPDLLVDETQQLTWDDIIEFCHGRFTAYRQQKSSVGIWERDGIRLKQLSQRRPFDSNAVRKAFSLHVPEQPEPPRNP